MDVKLNYRLPQTADRLNDLQVGAEAELRRRLQLTGSAGIVSADGADVDSDTAACALSVNSTDSSLIDVSAGTVVFKSGEFVDVSSIDLVALVVDLAVTDGQVLRLEYGETPEGDLTANPFYNFGAQPKTRKETPREMQVIETVTAYNAQTQAIKDASIVLGVVRGTSGVLSVDNARDTYTFSRPWSTPVDVEHRSRVGTGVVGVTNPHGTSANDLSVGSYSMWQALVGPPAAVLARPMSYGRMPGTACVETIPTGSFITDSTGAVTGKAGALYAYLGFWPDRLLSAYRAGTATEVAAWIPRGRNVIACFDSVNFAVAANLDINYTKVEAGALPGNLIGATAVTVGDPNDDELLVAGGNFFSALNEKQVLFTDVGLIPMSFDILADGAGKVYKRPDAIYCNTKLDTLGAAPAVFTIQPRAPSRLRVAISNFNAGFTEVRIQFTGTNEAGSPITEQVVFNSIVAAVVTSDDENINIRKWTSNIFATVTQQQVMVRNGDGPNTTVTVFAEYTPSRAAFADDLLLASVHWNGAQITNNYAANHVGVLDRRIVTTGGGHKGPSSVAMALNDAVYQETVFGTGVPSGSTVWATVAEDFGDPQWMRYPAVDTTTVRPIELDGTSLGVRLGYSSRKIPLANNFATASLDAAYLRLLPASHRVSPNYFQDLTATVTLFATDGTTTILTSSVFTNPFGPFRLTFPALAGVKTFFAVEVKITPATGAINLNELFQGYIFHIRA